MRSLLNLCLLFGLAFFLNRVIEDFGGTLVFRRTTLLTRNVPLLRAWSTHTTIIVAIAVTDVVTDAAANDAANTDLNAAANAAANAAGNAAADAATRTR